MQPEQRHPLLCTSSQKDLEVEEESPVLSELELAIHPLLSAAASAHRRGDPHEHTRCTAHSQLLALLMPAHLLGFRPEHPSGPPSGGFHGLTFQQELGF